MVLLEVVKEVMFISVNLPVMVRLDNVEAIFMAGNVTTMHHTKHVDKRYNYVNESIDKTVFVKSADSHSDILTKRYAVICMGNT